MAAADAFHREHAVIELAIRDLKNGAGLNHIPSGHYHANAARLACAVLALDLGSWTSLLANQPSVTNRTRRTPPTSASTTSPRPNGLLQLARRPANPQHTNTAPAATTDCRGQTLKGWIEAKLPRHLREEVQ